MQAEQISGDARAAVLRDVDTFGDWLGNELYQAKPLLEQRQIREATPEDFTAWPIPKLMALALDVGQHKPVRIAALDAIAERYMALPSSIAYAQKIERAMDFDRVDA